MPFPPTHPALTRTLAARGYDNPTPVQEAVLTAEAEGRDLLVSAQTGSGKTVAFGLAIAPDLIGEATTLPIPAAPLALVVAPTRELALQVHAELSWLYAEAGGPAGARVVACVGGMDPRREQRLLSAGAHIVVGTPGRLRDHIERGQLNPTAIRVVVLDEADEMLDLGFREELEFILGACENRERTLLFSATIAKEIAQLARRFQNNALRIDTVDRSQPHNDITYQALRIAPSETVPSVINTLRYHDARLAIVFCATREGVRSLWTALTERGFGAVSLSGEMSQSDRNQALLALRAGRARVCVATDVAARGLDLPELGLVIHADLPMTPQTMLHRSGRTGRAGRKGLSVLLVPPSRRRRAETLIAQAGVKAEWLSVASAEAIRARDAERLLADPVLSAPAEDEEADDRAAIATLIDAHPPEAIARALLRFYQRSLPEEEVVTEMPAEPVRAARAPATPRHLSGPTDSVWLSASVGRRDNADPKWLLPLLCRTAGIHRDQIGLIRILPAETRFEVSREAAERFLSVGEAGEMRFSPSSAPQQDPRGAPPRRDFNKGGAQKDGPRPPYRKNGPPKRPSGPGGAASRKRPKHT
ncbi:ATP-dependent RNA helicase DeaD [Endobacter medicaginis]|uniref:ATP-dependent RNA helicase DeaD n=4 Tax=Endobacter medicaginis TaxID=1181271 RepID=A0A839V0I6_9PROT|nr:DEAD/DEAH box helicase [Endobacter medicaginis]MBB3173059.1 ATP-dependent RNA helicase DeaD [Endobacter medicaginis]MCX5474516.1 DEAD/DEAH box helicase [Endobacter medicaginis]